MPERPVPSAVPHVVVVGGGPVAARLVEELRPALGDGALRVTVLGSEPEPAYQRIRIGDVASGRATAGDLALADPEELRGLGVDVRCGITVTAIDRRHRTLRCAGGDPGGSTALSYDRLVLATGAEPVIPAFPIAGGPEARPPGVMALRDLADARRLHRAVQHAEPVAVLGGGVLGVEAALALAEVGAPVTLLHRGDALMERQLDGDSGRLLRRQLIAAGVDVRSSCGVRELVVTAGDGAAARDGSGRLTALRTTRGEELAASLLVACTGVRPRDQLAEACGLAIAPDGGIVTDDRGRCPGDPFVLAAGDCAAVDGRRPSGLLGPGWEQARRAAAALREDLGCAEPPERDAAGRIVPAPEPPRNRLDPVLVKSKTLSVACAGTSSVDPWSADGPSVSTWSDPGAGQYLRIVTEGEALTGFVAVGMPRASAELARHCASGTVPLADRTALLAMEHATGGSDLGPADVLCRCSGATVGQVADAASTSPDVDGIGAVCGAGTGCGTCRGSIAQLLAEHASKQAAEQVEELVA